jgi:site-specific DNA recombinase
MADKEVRCAIYARVSDDAGLEQDFNSLDAQREAAEAFIKSQTHEGWRQIRTVYDDGGFSAGTLERPALQRLLTDVREGKVDVIVVYKVDRLTRSLADFAKLVELFDQHTTSFVSVTQAFNTTTSMGRLTLNVLLSFAQFEREVTAERIRDKIAASKKKGLWVGGNVPLGYRVENRKLLVDPAEARTVQMIFKRYLALGSMSPLIAELHRKGVRTRKRQLSNGKQRGGIPFTRGPLCHLLRNRVYLGELNHHGNSYPAEHAPIIEPRIFDKVQSQLATNIVETKLARSGNGALLQGILFDDRGNLMTPTYSIKRGVRYRYYACRLLYEGRHSEAGAVRRVSAPDLEKAVVEAAGAVPGANIRSRIQQVVIGPGTVKIILKAVEGQSPQEMEVSWSPKPAKPRREILLPYTDPKKDSRPIRSETRVNVVAAVAKGRDWLNQLISDPELTLETVAQREGRTKRSVQMHLSLSFLAPDILQALIAGKLPRGIGITRLMNLPPSWEKQRLALGLDYAVTANSV